MYSASSGLIMCSGLTSRDLAYLNRLENKPETGEDLTVVIGEQLALAIGYLAI